MSRFAQYAVNVWNIEMDFEHPEKTALAGIQATEDYFKSLDMPVSLRELNVDPASFEELAEKCIEEALFYGGLDNIAVVIAQNRNGR